MESKPCSEDSGLYYDLWHLVNGYYLQTKDECPSNRNPQFRLHTGFSDASQGTAQKKYKELAAKECIKSVF
jgi:hypothetical protein